MLGIINFKIFKILKMLGIINAKPSHLTVLPLGHDLSRIKNSLYGCFSFFGDQKVKI